MKSSRTPRAFGLVDGLILAFAMALGLIFALAESQAIEANLGLEPTIVRDSHMIEAQSLLLRGSSPHEGIVALTPRVRGYAYPFLLFTTIGAAAAYLRIRTKQSNRRVSGPGLMALAIGGTFALTALANEWISRRFLPGNSYFSSIWIVQASKVEVAIATAWIWMIAAARWRPEPSWIDRLGRLIGGLWIADLLWQRIAVQLF